MFSKKKKQIGYEKIFFYTKSTSKYKVCNVIIDKGNFENVVSNEMVEKLGHKTEMVERKNHVL